MESFAHLGAAWSFWTAVVLALMSAVIIAACRRTRFPPGPSGILVLMSSFTFDDVLYNKEKWRLRFGKIYSASVGFARRILITDYDVIYDAFVLHADDCSSRPAGLGRIFTGGSDRGITSSQQWKEQRKFALTVLRDQGMGKTDMGDKIMEEVGPFLKAIEMHGVLPLNVDSYMHRAISNVICNLILGARFEYEDPVFISLLDKFLNQSKHFRKMHILGSLPLVASLPGDIFGYHAHLKNAKKNKEYFLTVIRQHAERLDPDNPKDFIDAYLVETKARAEKGQPSSFDELSCLAVVIELFVAGTDTTANALLWAWLFVILYPDIQKKVQDEIEQRIGSRPPSLKDRANMPYVEAVLTEVLRLGNIAVGTLPHITDSDVSMAGYLIPSGTTVIASISDVHLDENEYPEPFKFSPERFLNVDGAFEKPKRFLPFGIGRRACIGESLARAELFLFFTSVLQHFCLEAPQGCLPKAQGEVGLAHKPLDYSVVFKRRLHSGV